MHENNRQKFTSLADETRSAISTAEAAYHLCRKEQTLRIWACSDTGPVRPLRIHGRLAWPVEELRRLLTGNGSTASGCRREAA